MQLKSMITNDSSFYRTIKYCIFILAGISLIHVSSGFATVFYVNGLGDDSNDGLSRGAGAWLTIQHAVENVGPGDTVIVESGVYAGCRIEKSGTMSDWITLKADTGASVLINVPGLKNRHESNVEIETWDGDGTVSYWVVEGFEVANAPRYGIDLRGNSTTLSHHFIIRNNQVHNNGTSYTSTGIFTAFVDHVQIDGNETYLNAEHGIYHSNSGDYPIIRKNRSHHNNGCGIHMNGDISMGNDGIISRALLENNILYENGVAGGSAINMDGVTDSIIRNNLIYSNHAGGIAVYQTDAAVCSQNDRILNNTIVQASDGRWCINIADPGCVNVKIFNNVIYTYHSWRGCIVIPSPSLPGFESDYNVVMDRFSADDDSSVITLAEWQVYGFDLHSLIAVPVDLFIAPGSDDYHLKDTSPAIDTGCTLPDVPNDIEGIPRPQGPAYDIGAYEYPAAPVPFSGSAIKLIIILIMGICVLLNLQLGFTSWEDQ